jgi:hypothetical protein
MKLGFCRQIVAKSSKYQISLNSVPQSRVILCGRTDITKPMVALRNFAWKYPNNNSVLTTIFISIGLYRSSNPVIKSLLCTVPTAMSQVTMWLHTSQLLQHLVRFRNQQGHTDVAVGNTVDPASNLLDLFLNPHRNHNPFIIIHYFLK